MKKIRTICLVVVFHCFGELKAQLDHPIDSLGLTKAGETWAQKLMRLQANAESAGEVCHTSMIFLSPELALREVPPVRLASQSDKLPAGVVALNLSDLPKGEYTVSACLEYAAQLYDLRLIKIEHGFILAEKESIPKSD